MNIALLTPVLHEGDAISNDLYGMYRVLRSAGHAVRLFAEQGAAPVPFQPMDGAPAFLGVDGVCIYHHSIGCTPALAALKAMECRRVVKYHNVTPARFFPDDLKMKLECAKGLYQLEELLALGCKFCSASAYNAGDIEQLDDSVRCTIVPPYNQLDTMAELTPDYPAVLDFHDACHNVLMVGRLAPNKNLVRAVQAFAQFSGEVAHRARLLIVGDPGNQLVSNQVRAEARRLGIADRVHLAGKVSLRQLKAFYLIADVLLLVSEHEGFGVPLVEALAMRVPVIASDTTGLPSTGGNAVRYVNPHDIDSIASALGQVLTDPDLREEMMLRGRERFENHFTNDLIDRQVLALVPSHVALRATTNLNEVRR